MQRQARAGVLCMLLLLCSVPRLSALVIVDPPSAATTAEVTLSNGDFPYTHDYESGVVCTGAFVLSAFDAAAASCALSLSAQASPFVLVLPWAVAKRAGCSTYQQVVRQAATWVMTPCAVLVLTTINGQVGYNDGEPYGQYPWLAADDGPHMLLTALNRADGATLMAAMNQTSTPSGSVSAAASDFTIMFASAGWNAIVWIFFTMYSVLLLFMATAMVAMTRCVRRVDRSKLRWAVTSVLFLGVLLRAIECALDFFGANQLYPHAARSCLAFVTWLCGFYVFVYIIFTYDSILHKAQMMQLDTAGGKVMHQVKRILMYVGVAIFPIAIAFETVAAQIPSLSVLSTVAIVSVGVVVLVVFVISLTSGIKLLVHLNKIQTVLMTETNSMGPVIKRIAANVVVLNTVFICLILVIAINSASSLGYVTTGFVMFEAVVGSCCIIASVVCCLVTTLSVRTSVYTSAHSSSHTHSMQNRSGQAEDQPYLSSAAKDLLHSSSSAQL